MGKTDILSLNLNELEEQILLLGEKKFRAKQIYEWLHIKKVSQFSEMSNLSKELHTKLEDNFYINYPIIAKKLESKMDNTVKYLYELSDGNYIETVLMDYHHGDSICVSTQSGCKMGCKFCASAIAGFARNLAPSEILAQVYQTECDSGRKISSVVLMGIGEPLDNFDNVLKFMEILSDKNGNNMSLRHVTLSTCGIVPMINELAERKLGITLAVSLHAAENSKRSGIMPVNNAYPIEELIRSCRNYINKTGRRITFEYSVIKDVNSSEDDAKKLASLLRGMNCHVNLIPVNAVRERNFKVTAQTVKAFQKYLEKYGINATIRRTLGSDINASCGQLRRNALEYKNAD
ncbi:MAG: 23S rRNA (adenine(2503)-C(2))-methyltransferase RlmN [Oscillospiraceae bacterium]